MNMDFFLIFAGNEDIHKSLDEFEIKPDSTKDYGFTAVFERLKIPRRLTMRKTKSPLFIRAINEDLHKRLG